MVEHSVVYLVCKQAVYSADELVDLLDCKTFEKMAFYSAVLMAVQKVSCLAGVLGVVEVDLWVDLLDYLKVVKSVDNWDVQ